MSFLKLLFFSLIVCLIHLLCVFQFMSEIKHSFILETYLFLFLLYLSMSLIKMLFKKLQFKSPHLVLSLNLLKILIAVIYLLPLLKNKTETTTFYVVQFFIAYFIFLAKEIIEKQQLKKKNNP